MFDPNAESGWCELQMPNKEEKEWEEQMERVGQMAANYAQEFDRSTGFPALLGHVMSMRDEGIECQCRACVSHGPGGINASGAGRGQLIWEKVELPSKSWVVGNIAMNS